VVLLHAPDPQHAAQAGTPAPLAIRRQCDEIRIAPRRGHEVLERGYNGLTAKDEASVYEAGPTRRRLKVEQKNWTVAEDDWRRRLLGEQRR
jgi:hypothetical protein